MELRKTENEISELVHLYQELRSKLNSARIAGLEEVTVPPSFEEIFNATIPSGSSIGPFSCNNDEDSQTHTQNGENVPIKLLIK